MARGFFDIFAWQKADDLAVDVYQITSSFPPDQRYRLTHQMQRAAERWLPILHKAVGGERLPIIFAFSTLPRGR